MTRYAKAIWTFVIIVGISAAVALFSSVPAECNVSCGLKPLRPLGCQNGYAECICVGSGMNRICYWVWRNCGY